MKRALMLVGLVAMAQLALAQGYKEDDPLPPGARGRVTAIQGRIVAIRGLASGVSGKAEALASALKELGAKTTGTEIRVELSSDVLFDFDKADLKPQATPSLEKVALVLKSYPNSSTTVEGHSDSVGDDDYNQRLSERRAQSVVNWMRSHGAGGAISARGWGESKPVAPNADASGKDLPENRQKNRRVEIVIRHS